LSWDQKGGGRSYPGGKEENNFGPIPNGGLSSRVKGARRILSAKKGLVSREGKRKGVVKWAQRRTGREGRGRARPDSHTSSFFFLSGRRSSGHMVALKREERKESVEGGGGSL